MKDKIYVDFIALNFRLNNIKNFDCHTNTRIIAYVLKKLGYNVQVVTGVFNNKIKHSWIVYKDFILETDCRQLDINKNGLSFDIIADKKLIQQYLEEPIVIDIITIDNKLITSIGDNLFRDYKNAVIKMRK